MQGTNIDRMHKQKSSKKNEVPTKREHYNYLISEYSKIPPNNHSLSGTNYTHSTAFQMTITQNITTVYFYNPKSCRKHCTDVSICQRSSNSSALKIYCA